MCHIRLAKSQTVEEGQNGEALVLYPVQMDTPPDRTRLLYFDSEKKQRACLDMLLRAQGYENQFDQYLLVKKLGDGAFSQVMLGIHRST